MSFRVIEYGKTKSGDKLALAYKKDDYLDNLYKSRGEEVDWYCVYIEKTNYKLGKNRKAWYLDKGQVSEKDAKKWFNRKNKG